MEPINATDGEEHVAMAGCWRRFRQWVHCFCVVTFDLELGQTIEVVYPGDAHLTAQERSDLCYLAFPDSNSSPTAQRCSPTIKGRSAMSCPSDSTHHFRIRRSVASEDEEEPEGSEAPCFYPGEFEQQLPGSLKPDRRFLHGFSYFRRQRDPQLPRGYFQKSIVLLSPLPFVAFFQRVLDEVALAFFSAGESAIETACLQMDRHWPQPQAGHPLVLPLLGLRFQCTIPALDDEMPEVEHLDLAAGQQFLNNGHRYRHERRVYLDVNDGQQRHRNKEEEEGFELIELPLNNNIVHVDLESVVHEANSQLFHIGIKRIFPHLQLIWELILLGEPLLILAPTPSLSSTLVHSLVSLISPLRYHGDHRPFFTIHDSDFNELSGRQNCCVNNFVIGATNPFFLKAFAHWPHILKMGPSYTQNNNFLRRQRSSESRLIALQQQHPAAQFVLARIRKSGSVLLNGKPEEEDDLHQEQQRQQQRMIKRLSDRDALDRSSGGLLSTHRQFLLQDKSLVRKLLRSPNDSASQWNIIRRHFAELTQSFINPLERYIATLLPLRRHLCPFQPVPPLRPFALEHFLASLRHFGHPGVKGDWPGLYRQFVARSPNFIGWLQQRRRDIERQLRAEHLEMLCRADLSPAVLRSRNQVEIVDLVLKLRDRLDELDAPKQLQNGGTPTTTNGLINRHRRSKQRGQSASPMKASAADRQRVQLQQQLTKLLSMVDDELKNVLLSNSEVRRVAEQLN